MLFNCDQCFRCCTNFINEATAPFLQSNEIHSIPSSYFHKVKIPDAGIEVCVMKRENNRCIAWSYNEQCTIYHRRPLDFRLYPFLLKNGEMIIHLSCPDAVRALQLLDCGDPEAVKAYEEAKIIIFNASATYLKYLEWQTKNFKFYCVVK